MNKPFTLAALAILSFSKQLPGPADQVDGLAAAPQEKERERSATGCLGGRRPAVPDDEPMLPSIESAQLEHE
jgi:hypothetical protein